MQPIATDTSSFVELREKGQVFVDKTAWFHKLATDPNCSKFFLARPRRFGKSLMISTFKAMFEGRRELFKGLAIEKADYDWAVHPVLQFNLGFC
ncbi:MAG: AAA family ATPase, partial [Planctomycetes bacterium]|nr:AAA family ATPase [Planctomycetota bacterium]